MSGYDFSPEAHRRRYEEMRDSKYPLSARLKDLRREQSAAAERDLETACEFMRDEDAVRGVTSQCREGTECV